MGDHHDHQDSNPVGTGLSLIEGGHQAVDLVHDADKLGMTWGNASHAFGNDVAELVEGSASSGSVALAALGPVLNAAGIVGSGMELIEGLQEGGGRGAVKVMGGGTGLISSGAGFAGLAGLGGASALSMVAGAAGLGVEAGDLFNSSLKEEGWFEDDAGNAESASEMAANGGENVEERVTDATGSHTLGVIAGGATTIGESIAGAGMGAAATAARAGRALFEPVDPVAMRKAMAANGVHVDHLPWWCGEGR